MEIVEYSSNHKILHSNSVILFDKNADLEIRIKMSEKFSFNLKITFVDGANDKISRKADEKTNTITFIMRHPVNEEVGPSIPIEVAEFNGKRILIQFVVKKLYDGEYKRIDYTLFEG